MSEELSTYRSSRGPKDRTDPAYNIGTIVRPGPIPRFTYTTGGATITKGEYVYAKVGVTLNFYEDSKAEKMVGPSGGKGGQSGNPSRSNSEYVGVTTGLAEGNMIQVEWVNKWYQDGTPGLSIGGNWGLPKSGGYKTETKISWVKYDSIDIRKQFTQTGSPDLDTDTDTTPPPSSGSGIDTTTLGYGAVAAALVFSMNKKKKRR